MPQLKHGKPTDPIDRTFIIGISGSPFSGKTTLVKNLAKDLAILQNVDVHILSQSVFICDISKAPPMNPFTFTAANADEKKWHNQFDPACVSKDFWEIVRTMAKKGKGELR